MQFNGNLLVEIYFQSCYYQLELEKINKFSQKLIFLVAEGN